MKYLCAFISFPFLLPVMIGRMIYMGLDFYFDKADWK